MVSTTVAALALGMCPLLASAGLLPRQYASYSFTMYRSSDCSGASDGTISNGDNSFPLCSPKLKASLGSVMVTSTANDHCKISFYNDSNHMDCYRSVAHQPKFQIGQCYTFGANERPTYYGASCQS